MFARSGRAITACGLASDGSGREEPGAGTGRAERGGGSGERAVVAKSACAGNAPAAPSSRGDAASLLAWRREGA